MARLHLDEEKHCFVNPLGNPNPIQAQLPQLCPWPLALQSLPMRRPSHVNGKEDDKFNNCLATGLGKGPSPNWVWWDTHSKQKKHSQAKEQRHKQTSKQTNKHASKQTNKQTNQTNKQWTIFCNWMIHQSHNPITNIHTVGGLSPPLLHRFYVLWRIAVIWRIERKWSVALRSEQMRFTQPVPVSNRPLQWGLSQQQ